MDFFSCIALVLFLVVIFVLFGSKQQEDPLFGSTQQEDPLFGSKLQHEDPDLLKCIETIDDLVVRCKLFEIPNLVEKVVDRLKVLRQGIIYLHTSIRARKDEEDYEDYLKEFGEAIKHITIAVRYIFSIRAEDIFEGTSIGTLIPASQAWNSLCILLIDELNDGIPHPIQKKKKKKDQSEEYQSEDQSEYQSEDESEDQSEDQTKNMIPDPKHIIEKIESLSDYYSSGVSLGYIEEAMKEALKKKNQHPQPKVLEVGIIIMKRQYSRYIEEVANSFPIVWRRVDTSSSTFKPSSRDIGKRLKVECFLEVEGKFFLANVTVTNKVEKYLSNLYRDWKSRGGRGDDVGTFNVLSYNILADLHSFNPYLSCYGVWEFRRKALLLELRHYNVDILCLQEVQDNHFAEFLAPKLEKLGYLVVYKTKNHTVIRRGEVVREGCAIFYRTNRFRMIRKHEVDYAKEAELALANRNENNVLRKELVKDNVALFLELWDSVNNSRIFVANTHIIASEGARLAKLFQVNTLLRKLKDFTKSKNIPLIICGDFNSHPTSKPYKLLVEGRLKSECVREIDRHGFFIKDKLKHEFLLGNVYVLRKELKFTTKKKETLDYIFYTNKLLKVEEVLKPPSDIKDLVTNGEVKGPSDHIALAARFKVK
ncbi:Endonuclease/exonuclease/phosphatase [Corchorus capsularis]|uniref:Endonuclease/exonuclease/phosphatase n=1 Tax=Corchorus capsularis TaxID=210143 RepID=A0A1R3GM88_COCAP|nr:Endonuclease/exonuclease/phosphatase [Corchorus capsularis]